MVEAILAAMAGGGTGLVGSLLGRVAGFFEDRQKIKRLQIELAHELKLQELQNAQRVIEREHELSVVSAQEYTAGLVASYGHDSSYNDSLLRWVRPLLTALLILCSFGVYATVKDLATVNDVAKMIIYYTGTAVAWWFADRSGRGK